MPMISVLFVLSVATCFFATSKKPLSPYYLPGPLFAKGKILRALAPLWLLFAKGKNPCSF